MKIITIVRARDEAKNIARFVMSYQGIADAILVADNESQDNTIEICKKLPKTQVRSFNERAYSTDKEVFRAPHGKHLNFLIDWAESEGADWIIMDDCDCIPNYTLKNRARKEFGISEADYIMVTRIYFYKDYLYFREQTCPTGDWTPSLWAWKANKGINAREGDPWEHYIDIHGEGLVRHDLMPPLCLLHYFYPDDETVKRKLDFYRHMRPGIRDPIEYGGDRLPLEEWMRQ